MPLFHHHIAVDWSAANSPTRGKDSIWIGAAGADPINIPTRFAAMDHLARRMHDALARDERMIIGFDFAFGYPVGTAAKLGVADWSGIWSLIHATVKDGPDNVSNRFEAAGQLNKLIGEAEGPFWGHPKTQSYDNLHWGKPKALFARGFPEWRQSDLTTKGAHAVWKLAYSGAVGSQTLLGIAALERFRRDPVLGPHIAIWPFETEFADDLSKPIIITEIFPTAHPDFHQLPYAVKDAQQVAQVSADLAAWDKSGRLREALSADELSDKARAAVLREEGWIVKPE